MEPPPLSEVNESCDVEALYDTSELSIFTSCGSWVDASCLINVARGFVSSDDDLPSHLAVLRSAKRISLLQSLHDANEAELCVMIDLDPVFCLLKSLTLPVRSEISPASLDSIDSPGCNKEA
ncbi:hypothetical protein PGB90_010062 [Kerria lacca]